MACELLGKTEVVSGFFLRALALQIEFLYSRVTKSERALFVNQGTVLTFSG